MPAFPAGFSDLVSVTGTTKFLADNGSSNGLGSGLQIAEYLRTLAHTWAQTQTITGDLQLTDGAVRLGTGGTWDTILGRAAAASFRLGAADAAAPVAQTLGVQNVVGGTTNTAGAAFTINGSRGTGTGAGGSLVFQVAPAGSSGSSQNALATAMTISSTRLVALESNLSLFGSASAIDITATGSFSTSAVMGRGFFDGGNNGSVTLNGAGHFGWSSSGATLGAGDTKVYRDAAGIPAVRNGTSAQAFRVYFSHTDASNYTRLAFKTATGVHTVETESAGTGEANIDLALTAKGTGRVRFGTHSALAGETVTGFITIKDAGGTSRKIAVVS